MTDELINIEKLDEEFLNGIKEVQLYFSALKTHDETRSCRGWLKKLREIDARDLPLRNSYLVKLIEQLKNGELKEPFNTCPVDDEPLSPLHLLSSDIIEGGDRLTLSNETKMRLEYIENNFKELMVKNELLEQQVKLHTDENKLFNDQIQILTTDSAELNKVKDDLYKICNREAATESEDFKYIKIITSQLILEVQNLKSMVVDDTRENKILITDVKKLVESMKEQQITDNKTMKQLNGALAKEINALNEIIISQKKSIDLYEKSLKRVEEYITNTI